jgi:hypothetical protein
MVPVMICAGFQEDVHPMCQHPFLHKIPLRTRQMYEVQELKVVCQRRNYYTPQVTGRKEAAAQTSELPIKPLPCDVMGHCRS